MKRSLILVLLLLAFVARDVSMRSQERTSGPPALTKDQLNFFENRIRPIFVDSCYKCHSPSTGTPRSTLELDWKGGWEKGGSYGPAIVPGNPEKSLLIAAVRYTDAGLQMPPDGKLPTAQIDDLIRWVRMGAPDPRTTRPAGNTSTYGGNGKNHWAFKALAKPLPPAVKNESWIKKDVDRFVLAKLEANGMSGNKPADKRVLMRRVYFDLIGLPPPPEQVRAFLADTSPDAFDKVVDTLLASPQYGERWGRHWLDVARYSDTKGIPDGRKEETPVYPYAWTYRDYVIKAFNDDLPYDRFIREQLAADRLPESKKIPATLAAMGFLTLGDHFNGNTNDIINDRIDVTTKAFLGLTVTCARCHDHKFDPIPTADYYSLYGIFASSTEPEEKPLISPPNAVNADYLVKRRDLDARLETMRGQNLTRLFGDYRRLAGVYLLATTMPDGQRTAYLAKNGADPAVLENWMTITRPSFRAGASIFEAWAALARPPAERFALQAPNIIDDFSRRDRSELSPVVLKAFRARSLRHIADAADIYGKLFARTDDEWIAAISPVWHAAQLRFLPFSARNPYLVLLEASDLLDLAEPGAPARANILVDRSKPADAPILIRGQAETPGKVVPRQFLEVLSGPNRPKFRDGSGRLELANAIVSKTNPLTARVMVNRVWQHHFGDGFVGTPDDFGTQSSPPTHPELLDWLASRFIADGWSMKRLHKLILMSATWQQSSENNPLFAEKDPFNHLLWRANVRRLEFEPLRDSILRIGGSLDLTVGGHPVDLTAGTRIPHGRETLNALNLAQTGSRLSIAPRRTVYGFVDRVNLEEVLNTFDFATPGTTMGKRYETTVPQQALFLMNSPIVIEQVRNVVDRDAFRNATSGEARIEFLYQLFFQRLPTADEIRSGMKFVVAFRPGSPGGPSAPARGRGAPPVRLPLNGWEEYAHILLLTNEMAFVN
jgi:hypothetical protein